MSQWVPFLSLFPLPQRRLRICHRKYVEFCVFPTNFFPLLNRYLGLFTIDLRFLRMLGQIFFLSLGMARGYGHYSGGLWLIRCPGWIS
jgi:hypothetical protein